MGTLLYATIIEKIFWRRDIAPGGHYAQIRCQRNSFEFTREHALKCHPLLASLTSLLTGNQSGLTFTASRPLRAFNTSDFVGYAAAICVALPGRIRQRYAPGS